MVNFDSRFQQQFVNKSNQLKVQRQYKMNKYINKRQQIYFEHSTKYQIQKFIKLQVFQEQDRVPPSTTY